MTILPIGKRNSSNATSFQKNKGFTFIEVMVSLIILSLGIVSILKVFIFSLDQLSYLGNRVYATITLDNKMVQMSRSMNAYNTLNINDINGYEKVDTGAKEINFKEDLRISEVPGFSDLFLLDSLVSWDERTKNMQLNRSMYLSNIHFLKE